MIWRTSIARQSDLFLHGSDHAVDDDGRRPNSAATRRQRRGLSARTYRPLVAAGADHFDVYGPTEATVNTTAKVCLPGQPITIGSPIRGYSTHILDEAMIPLPHGVKGELYVGGPGVSRGYLKQPELTRRHYVTSPCDGARLYRTGDRPALNGDGEVEFFGPSTTRSRSAATASSYRKSFPCCSSRTMSPRRRSPPMIAPACRRSQPMSSPRIGPGRSTAAHCSPGSRLNSPPIWCRPISTSSTNSRCLRPNRESGTQASARASAAAGRRTSAFEPPKIRWKRGSSAPGRRSLACLPSARSRTSFLISVGTLCWRRKWWRGCAKSTACCGSRRLRVPHTAPLGGASRRGVHASSRGAR